MTLTSPHNFVLILTGTLPPEVPPENANAALLSLFSHAMIMGQHVKAAGIVASSMDPIPLAKMLFAHVPPTVAIVPPKLVT